jgi:F-box-like
MNACPDILLYIFKHFDTIEMLKIGRVCKQWHSIIDYHLMNRQKFIMNTCSARGKERNILYQQKLWTVIRKYTENVTHFTWSKECASSYLMKYFCTYEWRNILQLDIYHTNSDTLLNIIQKCPNLKHINIRFFTCGNSEADVQLFCGARVSAHCVHFMKPASNLQLQYLPETVEGLELGYPTYEVISTLFDKDRSNLRFFRGIVTLHCLNEICNNMSNLTNMRVHCEGYPALDSPNFAAISSLTRLEYLYISSGICCIDDISFSAICDGCFKLQHLTMINLEIKDTGLKLLQNLLNLKSICFSKVRILNESVSIDVISRLKRLSSLIIHGSINRCTDRNLETLFNGLNNVSHISFHMPRDETSWTYIIGTNAAKSLLDMAAKQKETKFTLRIPGNIDFKELDIVNCAIERDNTCKDLEEFWLKKENPTMGKHCYLPLHILMK